MPRLRLAFALSLTLAACSGDDETPPIDAHVNPTPDASTTDVAPGTPDAETIDVAPGTPDATPTAPPVINHIAWSTPAGCMAGTASIYTIMFDVTDPDTAAAMLTFAGTVPGCTGVVNSNPDTLSCPNAFTYMGTLSVSDPEGNMDSQLIAISPCTDGMAP